MTLPKIPVVIMPGEKLTRDVLKTLMFLDLYFEVQTDVSSLGESVLTFDGEGSPSVTLQPKHAKDFVAFGVRAVFEAQGWAFKSGIF